ncbi:ParA family protein [Robbsia andropogonis]|uniref:ParA family protein n=1 Tax=Robbsia andropogonis TaxID=28092 RepID=UPI00209D203A|nr:ParA family protein [Robbsia andropogonis]MCP1121259.1 ParA family protein [Robbsia andropogonis]MCP1131052.1 ParA family protein [Robbsia andropogonis]
MAKVISFSNHKGGVSKTTLVVNISDALAREGYDVLIVDMDPQANATSMVYSFDEPPSVPVELVLDNKASTAQAVIQNTRIDGVHLIGSSLLLGRVARMMQVSSFAATSVLAEKLAPLQNTYDVIIIDTPPSLEFLPANALAASDYVFVPVQSGSKLSLIGTEDMLSFIEQGKKANPRLNFGGAILTRHDARKRMHMLTAEAIKEYYGKCLTTTIPLTTEIEKAEALGLTIIQHNPDLSASDQMRKLAREIVEITGLTKRAEEIEE